MELAANLGTVAGMVTLAVAGMVVAVGLLGRRIDDVTERINDMAGTLGGRMDRLAAQNDAILGAVSDLGQRVARLEGHRS